MTAKIICLKVERRKRQVKQNLDSLRQRYSTATSSEEQAMLDLKMSPLEEEILRGDYFEEDE